ncbi:VOC family protein [uncultured Cellulomonas sp.]|uniref:VOC family protein n=1 Tax=uncultured Cellulomonas sp. TaxID=189682 RepID=UPI00262D0F16|nr:VOC family protein [uncultured Cellulomonas sp.]
MGVHLLAVTFDAHDPGSAASFWARLLGREVVGDRDELLVPGAGTQITLQFVRGRAMKVAKNRVHLHLTSTDLDEQSRTVAAAIELGARPVDVGQRPEETHVVLADPDGNEFCVIEPGNAFLAGCGVLGEVACDGTREVGRFWSEALGWPLVWDQDQETAVQSPHGGTKVSWGGERPPARLPDHRQRLDLVVDGGDLDSEVERLVRLGATRLADGGGTHVSLADPDGNDVRLRA